MLSDLSDLILRSLSLSMDELQNTCDRTYVVPTDLKRIPFGAELLIGLKFCYPMFGQNG